MTNDQRPKRIRIPVDKAEELYEKEDVTVLDVVDTESYDDVSYKIKDAVRIDPEDIRDEYSQLPKDRRVLSYCT